jgi:hypothetical protein
MTAAIERKLNFRGKTIGEVRGEFVAKKARFERLWGPRLSCG